MIFVGKKVCEACEKEKTGEFMLDEFGHYWCKECCIEKDPIGINESKKHKEAQYNKIDKDIRDGLTGLCDYRVTERGCYGKDLKWIAKKRGEKIEINQKNKKLD